MLRRVMRHFQRAFGAGFLVLLPIGVTAVVFNFVFNLISPIFQPLIDLLPGPAIPGAGVVALLVLIYLAGLVAAFVVGRRLIALTHRLLEGIPFIRGIYGTTRTAAQLLSSGHMGADGTRFSGVVLIEFPRPGIRSIGMVTARLRDADGQEILTIYIPTTPIPSSGFLVIAPACEVTPLSMSVEDAMAVVISGGILSERAFQQEGFATGGSAATGTPASAETAGPPGDAESAGLSTDSNPAGPPAGA